MQVKLISAVAALIILSCSVSASADAATDLEPQAAIEYLLARVADSKLEFVRNDKSHAGPEAAKHMRHKYEHYANRIQSPEDFIELAATKSILSGKKYMVRDADGVIPTADWLHNRLDEYRALPNDHGTDSE